MSDYTRQNDFSVKDGLPSGSSQKIIKGSDVDAEFDALVSTVASKLDDIPAATTGNVPLIGASGATLTDSGYSLATVKSPYINVKAYGAMGDNSNDDTAEVQAAIDAAASAGGGVVFFPAGTYITGKLTFAADVPITLVGDGMGASTIKLSSSAINSDDLIHFDAGAWTTGVAKGGGLRGLTLDMNGKGRRALTITGWKFASFKELQITGMRTGQEAIYITQAITSVTGCREPNGLAFEGLFVASDGPAMKLHAQDVGVYATYGAPQITNISLRASQLTSASSHCLWALVDDIDDADQSTIGITRLHVDSSILFAHTDGYDAIRLECDGAAAISTAGDNGTIQACSFSGLQCEGVPGVSQPNSYGLHVLTGAGTIGGITFAGNVAGLGGTTLFLCEEETSGVLGTVNIKEVGNSITSGPIVWDQDDSATALVIRAGVATGSEREGQLVWTDKSAGQRWMIKKSSTNTLQVEALDAGGVNAVTMTFDESGNVVVGSAVLATSATDGFFYIPRCAGMPTGVPTTFAGRVPIVYDSTNDKLYVYFGGWKGVTVS